MALIVGGMYAFRQGRDLYFRANLFLPSGQVNTSALAYYHSYGPYAWKKIHSAIQGNRFAAISYQGKFVYYNRMTHRIGIYQLTPYSITLATEMRNDMDGYYQIRTFGGPFESGAELNLPKDCSVKRLEFHDKGPIDSANLVLWATSRSTGDAYTIICPDTYFYENFPPMWRRAVHEENR